MNHPNPWYSLQIFAPGVAAFGAAKYYELIFERELPAVVESSDDDLTADRVLPLRR